MTRVGVVIGWPVAHSKSPAMHNAAFLATGVEAFFGARAVRPAELPRALEAFRDPRFIGVSVTVPHKEAVASLCDRVEPLATEIGAVNCLEIVDGREVVGHNTDAGGFVDSLRLDLGVEPAGLRAVLLGGGGAARAVAAGLRQAGAAVEVVARTPAAAGWIAARPWTREALAETLPGCDLLVDCTSMGLDPAREDDVPAPIPLEHLPPGAAVVTLVYHRETALLAAARRLGLPTLDGAGMLVYQGARAFRVWTGREPPIAAMWAALRG
jgi:shikimate dehydrogenase